MDRRPLKSFIESLRQGRVKPASEKGRLTPWYNSYGDCIEFQSVDTPVIADRIDNYLTIYRSANDNKPIGFKIKDVKALMKQRGAEAMGFNATFEGNILVHLSALLLTAFTTQDPTIGRKEGYASAIDTIRGESLTASIS